MGIPVRPDRVLAGRYRLISPLGSGGMGTVWLALDELLGRQVAVKEVSPPPDVTEDERAMLRERTMREARIAARLHHANVVTVYDVVEDGGRPWIVMELGPARSLRDIVLQDGPLTPQQTAKIGVQVLAALRAAHAIGVMHRDVKPGNVLIDTDGRAVLADFGIARAQDSPTITGAGVILGSPSYLAPERARGEREGPESDLWSLGATLYAAVEGRPPYDRSGALATLMAVATQDPDPPRHSGPLWPVISGLLRREPGHRLGSAAVERMLHEIAEADGAPPTTPAPARAGPGRPGGDLVEQGFARGRLKRAERTLAFHPVVTGQVAPLPGAEPALPGEPAPPPPSGAGLAAGPDEPAPDAVPPVSDPRRFSRPRTWMIAALAAALLAAAGILIPHYLADHHFAPASPPAPASARSAAGSAAAAPHRTTRSPSPAGSATPGRAEAVPAGFHEYADPTGFSIAVPNGWNVSHDGIDVYIRDAGGTRFLLIDQTDHPKPDPLADWQQQEANRIGTYPGYHRVRLEAVSYPQAEKAADWEFTYDSQGGRTHVLNRNVLANSEHAYALYWSTPATEWSESFRFFQVFARTFHPAPA
jgi:hypothetical protein